MITGSFNKNLGKNLTMSNDDKSTKAVWVREYQIDKIHPENSKLRGVDQNGEHCVIKLKPLDEIKEKHKHNPKAVIPEINVIAQGNPKKAGCLVGADNAPENRTGGVLLVQDFTKTQALSNGNEYSAGWLSVLAHGPGGADPVYDKIGYIDRLPYFTFDSNDKTNSVNRRRVGQIQTELQEAQVKVKLAIGDNDTTSANMWSNQIRLLSIEFDELVSIRNRVMLLDTGSTVDYRLSTAERLENRLINLMDKHSINGGHGGVAIQVFMPDHNNPDTLNVVHNASGVISTRWDPRLATAASPTGAVTSPLDEVRRYLSSPRGSSLLNVRRDTHIRLTPMTGYNMGPNANRETGRPENKDKIYETYKDPLTHDNLARKLAVRFIHPKEDMSTWLVAGVHPTSGVIGNPLQVGREGQIHQYSHVKQHVPRVGKPSLSQGRSYIAQLPSGDRAILDCKVGTKGIGLYSGNMRIDEYSLVGPAPASKPSF